MVMQQRDSRAGMKGTPGSLRAGRIPIALAAAFLMIQASGPGPGLAQDEPLPVAPPAAPDAAAPPAAAKVPAEQLESLVAPIALYPDELLAQTLVAATYPLEIIQLQQWLARHPDLKDKALADEVAKQPWDPAIQSMAAVPEVVERLANDIQWTTDLGNAFLAQQGEVMDAVQGMRKKALDKGALESNEQQKVETQVVEEKTIIVVESANPEVIYVPSYSPVVVYGPPVYPYPPIYYPPYPPGAAFVSFSFGVMWGAAWGGSCCGCGWGGNDIDINVDNNFNQIEHHGDGGRGEGGRGGAGEGGKWNHNPEHRGGAPYGDRATANKFGGSARGDTGGAGASNRSASGGASSRGGGDQIGNRSIPKSSGSRSSSGFSSGSRGYSGSSAHASSSRGSRSMGGGGRGGGRGGRR
jgi:hypothetical protein